MANHSVRPVTDELSRRLAFNLKEIVGRRFMEGLSRDQRSPSRKQVRVGRFDIDALYFPVERLVALQPVQPAPLFPERVIIRLGPGLEPVAVAAEKDPDHMMAHLLSRHGSGEVGRALMASAHAGPIPERKLNALHLFQTLVQVRGQVSPDVLARVVNSWARMSLGEARLLKQQGCALVLVPSIRDYDPALAKTPVAQHAKGWTYDNCLGFYRQDGRRHEAVVAENYLHPVLNRVVRNPAPSAAASHELGHAIDRCLKDFSQNRLFLQALREDVAGMQSRDRQWLAGELDILPTEITSSRGLRETFAHLYTAIRAQADATTRQTRMLELLPQSWNLIGETLNRLNAPKSKPPRLKRHLPHLST